MDVASNSFAGEGVNRCDAVFSSSRNTREYECIVTCGFDSNYKNVPGRIRRVLRNAPILPLFHVYLRMPHAFWLNKLYLVTCYRTTLTLHILI